MKTLIRYSLIIIMLGLFSSCAEQFREIRGSENRGNAFLGGGLSSSTVTKRTDKAKGEKVSPKQTVINVEQAAAEPIAENTPNDNLIEPKIEKVENNQAHNIQGQKSSVVSKTNGSSARTLKKKKPLKPANFLKKAISRQGNGNSEHRFLESPYFGGSIGDWLLYINVLLSLIIIGLLLIYAFIDWTALLGIIPALIPLGISLYQYLIRENLYEEGGLFRFSFWLIAASFFAQFIAYPLLIMQWTQSGPQSGPPIWYIILIALLMLGLGLHAISYIDKFFGYLFDSWSDKHWIIRLLLGILFLLIILLVIFIIGSASYF